MWTKIGFFISACMLAGCSSANSAAPSEDDDSDVALEVASTVTDPGPRGGDPGVGGPYDTLSADEQTFFQAAKQIFEEVDSVSGKIEAGKGLGPTFNGNACGQCHAEPAAGGTSPHPTLGHVRTANPQVGLATLDRVPGQEQQVPSFITADGPIREARFVKNPDGSDDGGVHGLYTIAGRTDAPGCVLPQPNFAKELAHNNVIFRIPTPVFGLGLLESVDEDTLVANLVADADGKAADGISGTFNRSGNDGTITRFGWKAQNKSLLVFAGEAYNVEQGVSNELFPNERATAAGCQFNPGPEDATDPVSGEPGDTTAFATFMRLSAEPTPTTASPSELRGQQLFGTAADPGVGCVSCHSDTLKVGTSRYTGVTGAEIHPYSDLALHHMGDGLADGVTQGNAGGDQFRTAPLWGVGKRIFFLHDGRSNPTNGGLINAILAHSSRGSEARRVIRRFTRLPASDQQAVINFLRSL
ncbi:MAG TPA: di-heme oxidoredictase family protein [Kofleriaceae bacterium]|nr:di-heme oxidoredictase family protein [Kofleriaceae bacterium]